MWNRIWNTQTKSEPGREPGIHRHKQHAELPDTDEETDSDNSQPAHIRPRHEEDRRKGDQPKAEGGEEKRRKRSKADFYDNEVHRPADRDDER